MNPRLNYLKRLAPYFILQDHNVKILSEPHEFYSLLKVKAANCKKRIVFTSLYIGIGEKEKALVNSIATSLRANKDSSFRVHILLDSTRGSRPTTTDRGVETSRTMCLQLLQKIDTQQVRVSLYHTPNLRGFTEKILPYRVNEVLGLQHMKIYVMDDTLVISGANLSNDYFTNRQDRYYVFENSADLCDYYEELVAIVGAHSYQLTETNELLGPSSNVDPIKGEYGTFVTELRRCIEEFVVRQLSQSQSRELASSSPQGDSSCHGHNADSVLVLPLVQMGLYGVHQEASVLERLVTATIAQSASAQHILDKALISSTVSMASGYFNLDHNTEKQMFRLADAGHIPVNIVTAAPESNGFYKSRGPTYYVTDAYSAILSKFLSSCRHRDSVNVTEWSRPDWTFHAKGIWVEHHQKSSDENQSHTDGSCGIYTLVGSSNYGLRSRHRDLETDVLVHTSSTRLRRDIAAECERIFEHGTCAKARLANRLVPRWMHWLVPLLRHYL